MKKEINKKYNKAMLTQKTRKKTNIFWTIKYEHRLEAYNLESHNEIHIKQNISCT